MPRASKRMSVEEDSEKRKKKSKMEDKDEFFERMKREAEEKKKEKAKKEMTQKQNRRQTIAGNPSLRHTDSPERSTSPLFSSSSKPLKVKKSQSRKEQNDEFFEKMKTEAEEKKAEKTKKVNRRQTIAGRSTRHQSLVQAKKERSPFRRFSSGSEASDLTDEDEFDRLVNCSSKDEGGRLSTQSALSPGSHVSSRRDEIFVNRQKQLYENIQKSQYPVNGETLTSATPAQDEANVTKSEKNESTDLATRESISIFYSIAVFFLGALLVVGIFFTITTVDFDIPLQVFFGMKYAVLSDKVKTVSKNTLMLALVLCILYGGIETFMWFQRRAHSRNLAVNQIAQEAKGFVKKHFYPSEFIMEELLDKYDGTTLNGEVAVNRSALKSLWPDIEKQLLADARVQSSDIMVEGRRRRCLRFISMGSAPVPDDQPGAPEAKPHGQFHMF